jgi:itaconate CoA-transferase
MDPVPALGQHTDAILGALGYSDNRIGELRSAGVI